MSTFKPSHTEPLNCSFFNFNRHIDILRDDLIHPVVSGNKWRKLKYFIQDLKSSGKGPIVTFGGAYSNHLIATAFAGKYFDIQTHGFVRGNEKRALNHYEKSCIENNMTLQHVSRSDYKHKNKLFKTYSDEYPDSVFLDEGGDHPLALLGCGEILNELEKIYDYIVLSTGTGTTMEGLVKGIIERQLNTRIIGISALKNNFELDKRLDKYLGNHWTIFHGYHRGKYARIDEELINIIKDFFKETKIRLDPVYTGKMMLAVMDLYKKDFFKPDDKVLLIHTGGLLAFPEYR